MTQNAVWQLSVARANSMFGSGFAALAVEGAVAGLVAGLDGQALRELAGMSRSSRDEDVQDLLELALREAGVRVQMTTADAQVVYLRGIAIEVIFGRASVRSLTSWAHEVIGHDGADVAQDIVELDDELDLAEGGVIAKIDARPIIESFLRASLPLVERLIAVDEDPA